MRELTILRIITLICFFFAFTSFVQKNENPVSFSYEVKKISRNLYEVRINAKIDEPWHIYSQFTSAKGASFPTHINFIKNPLIEFIGTPEEKGKLTTKHEEVLNVNLKYFAGQVEFVQKVKLKANVATNILGIIEYMACTDQKCLLPMSEKFTLKIQ